MSNRHHPIVYAFEEPSTSSNFHHCAGINDITPSFRPGYFLSAGRDTKLLEWKINKNSNHNNQTATVSSRQTTGAVSNFKVHADWVNRILPIPQLGFVTAGADHIVRLSTVGKHSNNTEDDEEGENNNKNSESSSSYKTTGSDSFKHHGGTVKCISWLHHFNHDSLPGDPTSPSCQAPSAYNYDKLAMCSSDGTISTISLQRDGGNGGKMTHTTVKSMPTSLVPGTNPSSSFFVGTMNGVVHSVDVRSKLAVNEVIEEAHSSVVRDMLFYESKNILVTAGSDSLIRLWDVRHVMDPLVTIDSHGDAVWRLQKYFLPSSSSHQSQDKNNLLCFFSCGREGTVQLHDLTPSSSNNNNKKMTCVLAQTSHPVTSFLQYDDKLIVGTSHADILDFDLDLSREHDPSTRTPTGFSTHRSVLKNSSSSSVTSSSSHHHSAAIGLFANFIREESDDDDQQQQQQNQQQQVQIDNLLLEDIDQQQQQQHPEQEQEQDNNLRLLSPFKPPRTEARCSPKWATPVVENADNDVCTSNNDNNSSSAAVSNRPPLLPTPSTIYKGGIGFVQSTTFPTRMHVAVLQTDGEISIYDYINCTKVASFSKNVKFEDVVAFLEMKPGICPNWCQVNCNWGCVTVAMTESGTNGSFLNGWELQKGAHAYMTRLVEEIEKRALTSSSSNSALSPSSTSTSSSSPPASPTASNICQSYLQPCSQNQNGVDELRSMRAPKNVVAWAYQRGIIPAAREGRITKLIIKNLSSHTSDEDRRSQFELPVDQIVCCQNAVVNSQKVKAAEAAAAAAAEEQQQKEDNNNGNTNNNINLSKLNLLPNPVSAMPRWLLLLAERKVTTKDPSSSNVSFTCEPHPNPPAGFKKLPAAFESKEKNKPPSFSHSRSTQLSDLCYLIAKNLKKLGEKGPTFSSVLEARNNNGNSNNNNVSIFGAGKMNTSGILFPDEKNSNNNNNKEPEVVDRSKLKDEYAQPEEWIILFNGTSGTIIDPSLLLNSANSIFGNRGGFHIKYASLAV